MDLFDSTMAAGDIPQGISPCAEPNRADCEPPPLAIARVTFQPNITKVYKADTALRRGTIFPELDKPFLGKRGGC